MTFSTNILRKPRNIPTFSHEPYLSIWETGKLQESETNWTLLEKVEYYSATYAFFVWCGFLGKMPQRQNEIIELRKNECPLG